MMANQDELVANELLSSLTEFFAMKGINLEIGSDFSVYKNLLLEQPKRHYIGPKFTTSKNQLDEENAFWLIGRDPEGDIIHSQAVRTIELDGKCLADHMSEKVGEYSSFGHPEFNLQYSAGPYASDITGTVCYTGELWLKMNKSNLGSSGLVALLSRMAMALSVEKWSPDVYFAFMDSKNVLRGLAARCGFMHMEPASIKWSVPETKSNHEAWTTWVTNTDIQYLLDELPTILSQELRSARESMSVSSQAKRSANHSKVGRQTTRKIAVN